MSDDRMLRNVNIHLSVENPLKVYEGGTGGTDVLSAQASLDILPASLLGVPSGIATTPTSGIYGGSLEGGIKEQVTIQGPKIVKANQSNTFFITNYDINTTYESSTTIGEVTRDGDTLTLKTSAETGFGVITVNTVSIDIDVLRAIIYPPLFLLPVDGASDVNSSCSFRISDFATLEIQTVHKSTDWEFASDYEFTQILQSSYNDEVALRNWKVSGLEAATTYYVRARFRDNLTNESDWSAVQHFSTRASFAPTRPVIQLPAYGSTDSNSDALLDSSDFETLEADVTHVSTDWELSTSSVFLGTVYKSVEDEVNLTTWPVADLSVSTLYYARCRYHDSKGLVSEWSATHRFSTKKTFSAETPKIITPDNGITEQYSSVDIGASPFKHANAKLTHASSDWEVSEDPTFAYPVQKSYSNVESRVQWTVNSLDPGKTYYVRVRYRDSASFESPWSAGVSFTTRDSFAPRKPAITFPTNGATDATYQMLFRSNAYSSNDLGDEHLNSDWELSTNANFSNIVKSAIATANNKTSWEVNSLSTRSAYFLRVRYRSVKFGVSYVSDWSNAVSFSVQQVLPSTPGIMTPVNGMQNVDPVLVNFTASAFMAGEPGEVHASSDWQMSASSTFGNLIKSSPASTAYKTSWAVADLDTDMTYYVRVKYRSDLGNESAWSPVTMFNTKAGFVAMAPAITTPASGAKNVAFDSVSISCTAYVYAEGGDAHLNSDWELSTDPSFSSVLASAYESVASKTTWVAMGLAANTTYYARVRHRGSVGGDTPWSDGSSFTTKEEAVVLPPNTPDITDPASGASSVSVSATIRSGTFVSTTVGDAHKNSDWELASDSAFTTVVKSAYASSGYKTSWSVAGLTGGATYYVRVKHRGTIGGDSQWSAASSFSTKIAAAPPAPSIVYPLDGAAELETSFTTTSTAFTPTTIGDTHKNSDWQVSTDNQFRTVDKSVMASAGDKTSWFISNLFAGTTYYVRVKHRGTLGTESAWSYPASFKTYSSGGQTWNEGICTPVITAPSENQPGLLSTVNFNSSAFESKTVGVIHENSDWELAADASFNMMVSRIYGAQHALTTWEATGLQEGVTYFARVRYKGSNLNQGSWSAVRSFVINGTSSGGGTGGTTQSPISTPIISTPVTTGNTTATAKSSAFYSTDTGVRFLASRWELSTTPTFTTVDLSVIQNSADLQTYNKTGLTPGTSYYLRVKYTDNLTNESDYSPVVLFTTGGTSGGGTVTDPAAPVFIAPTPAHGSTVSGLGITLTTGPFSSASGDRHVGTTWTAVDTATGEVTSVENTPDFKTSIGPLDFLPGKSYRITAKHHGAIKGASQESDARVFSTKVTDSAGISAPSIISPSNNFASPLTTSSIAVRVSKYTATNATYGHARTDLDISTSGPSDNWSRNNTIVKKVSGDVNKDSTGVQTITFSVNELLGFQYGSPIYIRARHVSTNLEESGWSSTVQGTFSSTDRPRSPVALISSPSGSLADAFGQSVAMSSNAANIAVGAPTAGNGQGLVYLFRNASGTPALDTPMVGLETTGSKAKFGTVVCLSQDGSKMAVSAPYDGNGKVHLFAGGASGNYWRLFDGPGNTNARVLTPVDGSSGMLFGQAMSMSLDGTVIAVGSPSDTLGTFGSVCVYVLNAATGVYDQKSRIINPTPNFKGFGSTVELSGDGNTLYVGTPYAGVDEFYVSTSGIVHRFNRQGIGATFTKQSDVKGGGIGGSIGTNYDGSMVAFTGTKSMTTYLTIPPVITCTSGPTCPAESKTRYVPISGVVPAIYHGQFASSLTAMSALTLESYYVNSVEGASNTYFNLGAGVYLAMAKVSEKRFVTNDIVYKDIVTYYTNASGGTSTATQKPALPAIRYDVGDTYQLVKAGSFASVQYYTTGGNGLAFSSDGTYVSVVMDNTVCLLR